MTLIPLEGIFSGIPIFTVLCVREPMIPRKTKWKVFLFSYVKNQEKTWMYQLLDTLTPHLDDDFKHLTKDLYCICENGFYVYAKKRRSG